jgi:hypothetical protein
MAEEGFYQMYRGNTETAPDIFGARANPNAPQRPLTEEEKQQQLIARINAMFSGREPEQQKVYQGVFDLQKNKLDEAADTTRRNLRFGLADRGLIGGSADIDANALESRQFSKALVEASEAAQGQADTMKANDERTRLNLLGQVRSGLDEQSATQSAFSQMQSNADQARQFNNYATVDRYLQTAAPILQQQQVQAGVTDARRNSVFGVPRNYQGTITR